jgi:ribosomal protein S27AE
MIQQLVNKEGCPRCGKNNLITDNESGELFCAKCGFVIPVSKVCTTKIVYTLKIDIRK